MPSLFSATEPMLLLSSSSNSACLYLVIWRRIGAESESCAESDLACTSDGSRGEYLNRKQPADIRAAHAVLVIINSAFDLRSS